MLLVLLENYESNNIATNITITHRANQILQQSMLMIMK